MTNNTTQTINFFEKIGKQGDIGLTKLCHFLQKQWLLVKRIYSRRHDITKDTALLIATLSICAIICSILIIVLMAEHNKHPTPTSPTNIKLLTIAKSDNMKAIQRKFSPKNSNVTDSNGNTPLMEAALSGRLAAIKFLLEEGAKVNVVNLSGSSALMATSLKGHTDIAKTLITHGSNPNIQNTSGKTALIFAVNSKNIAMIKLLLLHGAIINHKDHQGNTPLIYAATIGDLNIVQYLMTKGANINTLNHSGQTAISQAAYHGQKAVVNYLLSKGASFGSGANT